MADEVLGPKFTVQEGEMLGSMCVSCKHKFSTGGFCTAFPQGIPLVILRREFDHRYPYPGDNGIMFERDG